VASLKAQAQMLLGSLTNLPDLVAKGKAEHHVLVD
jgi:hypothetical protein